MKYFNYLGKKVYYEITGKGEPVILLNGIMMSMKSWDNVIDPLNENFKVIRVDFLDQGLSDTHEEDYTQDIQVELIKSLLEHLEIEKINVVGISYGGEVALNFATKYQDKVNKLIIYNSVSHTNEKLAKLGHVWNKYAKEVDAKNYYLETIPIIYSKHFKDNNVEWMNNREKGLINGVFNDKNFLNKMIRLTNSAESYDVRDKLDTLEVPVLIVGAEEDYLTPLQEQRNLAKLIKNSSLIVLPNVGHASMYEDPFIFNALIIGYLKNNQFDYKIWGKKIWKEN